MEDCGSLHGHATGHHAATPLSLRGRHQDAQGDRTTEGRLRESFYERQHG
jgi:hypothetical protein